MEEHNLERQVTICEQEIQDLKKIAQQLENKYLYPEQSQTMNNNNMDQTYILQRMYIQTLQQELHIQKQRNKDLHADLTLIQNDIIADIKEKSADQRQNNLIEILQTLIKQQQYTIEELRKSLNEEKNLSKKQSMMIKQLQEQGSEHSINNLLTVLLSQEKQLQYYNKKYNE